MSQIMTVLGPIEPEQLGVTSMHEHVLIDWKSFAPLFASRSALAQLEDIMHEPISLENYHRITRLDWTESNLVLDDEEVMAAEVSDFKESGGSALVDLTPLGDRLDVLGVRRISEKTGVHIITSTGIYYGDHLSGDVPRGNDLKDLMIKEIEQGIDDTGVKAGHIRVAITDLTEKTVEDFGAVASVVRETGVSVHVTPGFEIGNDGRRIAQILCEQGMDLERLIMGRSEMFLLEYKLRKLILEPERWGLRLDYHRELLDQGVTLCIDAFGTETATDFEGIIWPPDWMRLAAVVALINEGYSKQIVLGIDVDFKYLVRRYGGPGYIHLTKNIIPMFRELGVSNYDVRQMMVHNPARLLAF